MLGSKSAPLRINGERFSKMYTTEPKLAADGADFYSGDGTGSPADLEARMWIDHVKDDSAPLVTKPEQAYVVTQILEAIYESQETGKPVFFE